MATPHPLSLPICADCAEGSQFLGLLGVCPGKRSTDVFRSEDLSGKAVQRSGAAAPIRAGEDGSGMKESNGG